MTPINAPAKHKQLSAQSGHSLAHKLQLIHVLARREVDSRYRGSALGIVWSMVTPLLMLAIYTFVFGTVFKSRWVGSSINDSPMTFAVILFTGLILFQIFSETVNRAPTLMLSNVGYVKKVVFPLEILVPVALCNALFHGAVSMLVLLPCIFIVFDSIPPTAFLLPVVVAPLLLFTLGISWFLASLGTYLRDIGQITATITTALLFLAPIFFPLDALPEWVRPLLVVNPISLPVEQAREVLLFGNLPDFVGIGLYTLLSIAVCTAGFVWFQKTKKGFADVL